MIVYTGHITAAINHLDALVSGVPSLEEASLAEIAEISGAARALRDHTIAAIDDLDGDLAEDGMNGLTFAPSGAWPTDVIEAATHLGEDIDQILVLLEVHDHVGRVMASLATDASASVGDWL